MGIVRGLIPTDSSINNSGSAGKWPKVSGTARNKKTAIYSKVSPEQSTYI
jgi:hypothetical protein